MKKKLLILIAVLVAGLIVFSGCEGGSSLTTFDLYGRVIDEEDSSLENVEVTILENNTKEITNAVGLFKFNNLRSGVYDLKFEKMGYNTLERRDINIIADEDLGNIRMFSNDSNGSFGNAYVQGKIELNNKTEYETEVQSLNFDSKISSSYNRIQSNDDLGYIEDEIIVKYKTEISSQQLDSESVNGLSIGSEISTDNGKLIKYKLTEGKSLQDMLDYFNKKSNVIYAEPNYKIYALDTPNDPQYTDQHQWGLIASNLEAGWDKQTNSSSVTVAILDTAVAIDHPDLEGNIVEEYNDFIYDNLPYGSHGTHIAGIIGAVTNNNEGIAGVSWDINLIPIAVLENDESGTQSDVAEAINFVVDNELANIINLSLGSTDESQTLKNALGRATEAGIIVVAAAGNDKDNILFPASDPNTISVGAINSDYNLADYSKFDKEPDILAPGSNIYSTVYNESESSYDYGYMTGTSMSAAHVSGIAALLLENDSGIDQNNILDRLVRTGVDLDDSDAHLTDAYGALLNQRMSSIPVRIFAANIRDGAIYIRSDITEISNMNYSADYSVNNAAEEELSLVAWRDVTGSGKVEPGDYFGVSDKVSLSANFTNNVNVNMYYLTNQSSVSSLSMENNGIEVIFEKN